MKLDYDDIVPEIYGYYRKLEIDDNFTALLSCKNLKIVYSDFLHDSNHVQQIIEKLLVKGVSVRLAG